MIDFSVEIYGGIHSYKTHISKLAQQSMLELLHLLHCYSRLVRWFITLATISTGNWFLMRRLAYSADLRIFFGAELCIMQCIA